MADKVGNGKHKFIKRALLVTFLVALSFAITYVSVSAVVLFQFDSPIEEYVGKVYSTFERNIACYFESDKLASYIIDGHSYICDISKKDNVIFLTQESDETFEKELVLMNNYTFYSNTENVYLHMMGGIR